MKVAATQGKFSRLRITEPRQHAVVVSRKERSQTLTPGPAEHRFEQIVLILGAQRSDSLDHDGSCLNVAKTGSSQLPHERAYAGKVAFRESITFPVVVAHGFVDQPLQSR